MKQLAVGQTGEDENNNLNNKALLSKRLKNKLDKLKDNSMKKDKSNKKLRKSYQYMKR